ncbi:MAG TPA: zinc ribbon domain-containing protein [Pseudacidobacterium sp.]|nr:zinc ribbon domain-containing protein [Pseudacidobacterium sp.]
MFCSGCGQAMQAFEQVCPKCGRPVPPMPVARPPYYSRVHRHIQTLGILWMCWAILNMAGWLFALPFLAGVFGGWGPGGHRYGFGPGFPFPHMMWLPGFITVLVFGRSLLAVITGFGLLRRAPWGRTLALITAFLTLIKPFTGTVLSIYTLWVLLPAPSSQEYEQIAVP